MKNIRSESEIIASWQKSYKEPKVSICCITYNHESYIQDTLEGFLRQETNFSFEILIHDDASTDKTAQIIKKYQSCYPNLIKPIYQSENQLSKGGISPNLEFNYPRAQGEYIALCDGDDYWTDSKKLSKQVEFLEKNKSFIGVTHKVEVVNEKKEKLDLFLDHYNIKPSQIYTIKDFEYYKLPGQTSSILYRNIWKNISSEKLELFRRCKTNGDRKLALLLSLLGNIYQLTETMSMYRKVISFGTSWSARKHGQNLTLKRYKDFLELNDFAEKAFGRTLNLKKQRLNTFYSAVVDFVKRPSKERWHVLKRVMVLNKDKNIEVMLHLIIRFISWPIRKIEHSKREKVG